MKSVKLLALCLVLGLCVGTASAKMVSYWDFETDFNDQAGVNHGTVAGDVQLQVDGERGNVAAFGYNVDGIKSALDCGNDPSGWLTGSFEISIAMWVKDFDSGDYGGLLGVAQNDSWHLMKYVAGNGLMWNTLGTDDVNHNLSLQGGGPFTGSWTHVAATWDGATKAVWINGNLGKSQPAAGVLEGPEQPFNPGMSEDNHLWIGRHFNYIGGPEWGSFIGWMDDVCLYDEGLTEEQIEDIMNNGPHEFAIPGDFDGDGDVDGIDFGLWQGGFPMASGAGLLDGDADGDGDVDGIDFGIWQDNFVPPSPAVYQTPEPATLALLLPGGLALLRRKR